MRYFKSEINRKVLAITLLPAALVAFLLTLTSSMVQTSAMEKSLSERGLAIVRQLAPACEYGVYSANQDMLRPLVESVMREPDVVGVVVRDAKGKVLLRGGGETAGSADIDYTSTQPGVLKPIQMDSWSFYAPIYQSEFLITDFSSEPGETPEPGGALRFTERILGWVSVEISTDEMASIKTDAWSNSTMIAVAVLLAGGLLALHLGKGITYPITQLLQAVNKVERGNLDIRIDTEASGELKSLEQGINKMVSALRGSRGELETKVDKATEELRVALDDLAQKNIELDVSRLNAEKANREKSAFLANISHEIRTPLHGAMGFIQLLSDTRLLDEQKVYIDRVSSSIKALSTLLNDILDFSRLEVSKLKLECGEFKVSTLLDDIVTIYAWEVNEKGIELVTLVDRDIPECLYGSGDRISQVLRNLVSNAIKFTTQGEIAIRLEKLAQVDSGRYRFSVTDTGIGIPPEERGKLFQPFSQLESGMRRNYGGVGLGLVISKALVELMDGRIFVNSIEGVGTCFSVELNLSPCDSPLKRETPRANVNEVPCWILSPVENIQASLQQTFLRLGGTVLTGSTLPGADALQQEISSSTGMVLVIVDALFSDNEITAFLRSLGQHPLGFEPVLVLLETANGCAQREQLCRSFNHRLTRPLTYKEIEDLLQRACELDTETTRDQVSSDKALKPLSQGSTPAQVLLVDDHVINREYLNTWMTKAGISVDEAKNGAEAIEACANRRYDLILMDLHMPVMDGFQAIEAIRTSPNANRKCRILAITADATQETISQIGASGFDGFLIKPVTQASLHNILHGDQLEPVVDFPTIQAVTEHSETANGIVDEEEGMRLASGNRIMWQRSLKNLAQRLPEYRERMQQAVEKQAHEDLSEILHVIQGAASYCGAIDLLSAIKRLQTGIRDDWNEACNKEFIALLDSIASFENWVAERDSEN